MHAGTEGQGLWQAQDDVSERHGVRIVCQVCVCALPHQRLGVGHDRRKSRHQAAQQLRRERALLLSAATWQLQLQKMTRTFSSRVCARTHT